MVATENNKPEQILKLVLESKLTRNAYQLIRNFSILNSNDLFCPYKNMLEAKKKCYPDNVQILENGFILNSNEIIRLTLKRWFEGQIKNNFMNLDLFDSTQINMISITVKIGLDGAHTNSEYNIFLNSIDSNNDKKFIFTNFIILKIDLNGTNLYNNDTPNSVKLTRPLALLFEPENADLCRNLKEKIENDLLNDLEFLEDFGTGYFFDFSVHTEAFFCGIDGKMLNAFINNRATKRCNICLLTYKDYTKYSSSNFNHESVEIRERCKLGIQNLHFQLNSFNFLLKIGHHANFKNKEANLGRKLTKHERDLETSRFREIYQGKFIENLKVKVDFVDPGYGRTNTGPNVSRCMGNYFETCEILGINVELGRNFNDIIKFLYSDKKYFELDLDNFEKILGKNYKYT